jgi:hypothetical protein
MEGEGAGYVQGGRVPRDASVGSSKQQGPSLPNSESSKRVNEVRIGAVTVSLRLNCMQQYKSSSPASIVEAIGQLQKGAKVMMFSAELMHDWITNLERANETATKRRQCRKNRIPKYGALTKGEKEDVLAQKEADQQIEHEQHQGREQLGLSRRAFARCKKCREPGHNLQTCKEDAVNTN